MVDFVMCEIRLQVGLIEDASVILTLVLVRVPSFVLFSVLPVLVQDLQIDDNTVLATLLLELAYF